MELFLDTEFTGLQQGAQLISLALVSADEQWFYAEFTDYELAQLSDWHQQHILPFLFLEKQQKPDFASGQGTTLRGTKTEVKNALNQWLNQFEQIEIWADALAYDWVFFCELFGGARWLPENIFYLPFDLVTLLKLKNIDPDIDRESLVPEWVGTHTGQKHNALYDAFVLKNIHQKLTLH